LIRNNISKSENSDLDKNVSNNFGEIVCSSRANPIFLIHISLSRFFAISSLGLEEKTRIIFLFADKDCNNDLNFRFQI
jgi:hypothetical protein